MKMTVATIGINFDSNNPLNELKVRLPEVAKMLSAEIKEDPNTLWITFSAFTSIFEADDLWREYNFVVCKCNYTSFYFDDHKYINNITVNNESFAVFYNKGIITAS